MKDKARMEFSAGGIVYHRVEERFEIAFIKDQKNKWTFAKGHIEPGETNSEAARREVEEEMGLHHLKEKEFLGAIDFWFKDQYNTPGALIKKRVYYFLFENQDAETGQPQTAEQISEVKWVPIETAADVLEYINTKKVLKKAIEILKNHQAGF